MDLRVAFHQPAQRASSDLGNVTAVIGRNGTGKSHLLSAIVQTFVYLEELLSKKRSRISQMPLLALVYRVGPDRCEARRTSTGYPHLSVNGILVDIDKFPLPKRVVALTISPFDKFVVPITASSSRRGGVPSIYRYLGLRDRTGRAAIENLLFRSLNSLFETSDNEALKRVNIGRVFEFLQLKARLNVIYSLRVPGRVERAVRENQSLLDEDVIADSSRLRRTKDVLKSGDISESDFRELLTIALNRVENGTLRLAADFEFGGTLDKLFLRLRPLRRAGFLQLRAVEVTQANGLVSDLKRASSGQLSMATALLSLAAEITNGSLVLIDEPELSLHPEWQVKYIDLLLRTFSNYSGCHFIIATHSPMVISELPPHATVLSLDNDQIPSSDELSGQSADYLLAEAFGLPTNNNRYVKDQILQALRLAARGESSTSEFQIQIAHLHKFSERMEANDPVRTVIDGLEQIVVEASKESAP